jgi:hypothetical protein
MRAFARSRSLHAMVEAVELYRGGEASSDEEEETICVTVR